MSQARLSRLRWAVRATLAFGVAASVAANILHAQPHPVSQAIAAWPPLALLLTVELVSRVPVHRKGLAAARMLATAVISGIAAWVSYWHMAGVAARYGETGSSAYLLPISVDGLIVVSSICLVELAGHLHRSERSPSNPIPTTGAAATAIRQRAVVDEDQMEEPGAEGWPPESDEDEGSEPGRVLAPALVATARQVAREHQASTGQEITRDQLRAALRTSNATAGALLRQLRQEEPTRDGNGRRAIEAGLFGEVTR